MNNEPWRPKPGELVQIWDYQDEEPNRLNTKIRGHGDVGYVVKLVNSSSNGDVWKVICFGDDEGVYHNVWHGWLKPVNKLSDIREVKDD